MDNWVLEFRSGDYYSIANRIVLNEGDPIPRVGERVEFQVSDIPSSISISVRAVQYNYVTKVVTIDLIH